MCKKHSHKSNGGIELDMITERDRNHFSKYGVHLIHLDCDPSYAESKQLPRDALLVECALEDSIWFDIVRGSSRVSVFDAYYDLMGDVIKKFSWTKGNICPKIYEYPGTKKDKKK